MENRQVPPGSRVEPPSTAEQLFNQWEANRRVPVPFKSDQIFEALIISMEREPDRDKVVIKARLTRSSPIKKFTVIVDPRRPEKVRRPVLWLSDVDAVGEWL